MPIYIIMPYKQNMFRLDILFNIDSNRYTVHTSFNHVQTNQRSFFNSTFSDDLGGI